MSEPRTRQRIVIVRGRLTDRRAEQADANRVVAQQEAPTTATPPQQAPATTGTTSIQAPAAPTISCPACGNPVVLGSPFCVVCGQSPYQRPSAAAPASPEPAQTPPAAPVRIAPAPPELPELPDDADQGATVIGGAHAVKRVVKLLEYYVPLPGGELLQVMPNGDPVPMTLDELRARQARKVRATAAQRQIESLQDRAYWGQQLIDAAQQQAPSAPAAQGPPAAQGGSWGYQHDGGQDGWSAYVPPEIGAQEGQQWGGMALLAPAHRGALPAPQNTRPQAPTRQGWSLHTMRVPTWLAVVIFLLVIHTGLIYLPPTSAGLVGAELPLFQFVARAWPISWGPVPLEPHSVGAAATVVPVKEGDNDEFTYQRAPSISDDQFCTTLVQWDSPMAGECQQIYGDLVLLGIEPAMALDESASATPGTWKTGIGAPPPRGLNNLFGMIRLGCSGDPTPCAVAYKSYRANAWDWSRSTRTLPVAFDLAQRLQLICNNTPPSEAGCSTDTALATRQKHIREIRAIQPTAPPATGANQR